MTATGNHDQAAEVLAALDLAVAKAIDAGYDADEIIDTIAAMVYPDQH